MVIYKEHKKFLDILAIQANRKPYNPRKKGEEASQLKQGKSAQDSGTFLTSVGGSPGKQQRRSKDSGPPALRGAKR